MTTKTESKKSVKYYGMPWWFALAAILVVYLATYLEVLTTDMGGTLALMLAIAIPLNEIGKRIPIWNKYVGGGLVLTFLGAAVFIVDDDILGNVHQSTCQVTSFCRTKCGICQTFSGTMGRNKVFQSRKAFAKV